MKFLLIVLGLGLFLQLGLVTFNLNKIETLYKKHQDKVERAFEELNK